MRKFIGYSPRILDSNEELSNRAAMVSLEVSICMVLFGSSNLTELNERIGLALSPDKAIDAVPALW